MQNTSNFFDQGKLKYKFDLKGSLVKRRVPFNVLKAMEYELDNKKRSNSKSNNFSSRKTKSNNSKIVSKDNPLNNINTFSSQSGNTSKMTSFIQNSSRFNSV